MSIWRKEAGAVLAHYQVVDVVLIVNSELIVCVSLCV